MVEDLSLESGTGSDLTTPEGNDPEAVGILSLIVVCVSLVWLLQHDTQRLI